MTTGAPLIRGEAEGDAPVIHALIREAFANAEHRSGTEQHIVDALREAGALAASLVAQASGSVVGHVAFSPVMLSTGEHGWFGLGPVSVLPVLQRSGIGSRLVARGLELLREHGAAGCVVLGDPNFYGRFGFRASCGPVLPGVPPAYFQSLAFGARVPAATVHYHPAFSTRS